jgi:hypothetical protein
MTVYDESLEMVTRQVDRIRELYPNSTVILFYDGVPSMPIPNVIHVNHGRHLKTKTDAGKWMHLWLSSFLENSSDPYMLKIDPDTQLLRPISNLPTESSVFGSIRIFHVGRTRYFRIHGGGVGYSRSMVERIVSNKWFESPEFISNFRFLDQEDVMLAHVIEREKLHWIDHSEFSCGRPITDITAVAHR